LRDSNFESLDIGDSSTRAEDRDGLVGAVGRSVQAYQRSTDALDDAVAERLGVNRTDLRCLDALYEGARTIGQLGEASGLSSAAATALIDRLEQKGFVRRVRDSADRRKIMVELTSEATEMSGRLYAPLVAEGARLLAGYSKAELSLLRRYLVAAKEITDSHRRSLAPAPARNGQQR
jgi:DNA-binding MarR family transcriptional regulator